MLVNHCHGIALLGPPQVQLRACFIDNAASCFLGNVSIALRSGSEAIPKGGEVKTTLVNSVRYT